MFARIVHADWSKHPTGRWCASARWTGTGWRASDPAPVGDLGAFVDRLVDFGLRAPTLAAFDFPIGLPAALVSKPEFSGFTGFRAALHAFGEPPWEAWFEPAATPAEIGVRRPFYPATPGAAKLAHLLEGLGATSIADLTRATERGGAGSRAAGCMFWLVGAKTVGKAAIHGWREAIRPALAREAWLWPFDGDLAVLAERSGLVLAESYPADACFRLGLAVRGKTQPTILAAVAPRIESWVHDHGVELSPDLRDDIATGFARHGKRCGDAFDAVIGLLAAIAVADGLHADGAPRTNAVRDWEGWILGRRMSPGIPASPGAFTGRGET